MAIKSSRGVTSGKGTPQRLEGQNGDITIRTTPFGKKLFVKDANKWHSINLDVNTSDLNSKINALLKDVRSLKNSTRNRPVLDSAILRKPGAANIQLKNNSGALNIRNAADDGDVQLGVGYGGTGLTSISTLLNSNTSKTDVGLDNVTNDAQLPLTGGQMTGNITFSGSQTVDGRDLSADGSKLDGVENNATADQTGAEIKSLYEAESDTNAFTDSLSSKLAGIESGATADQTGSEIKTALFNESDTNNFTDALNTKLSGIEDNATADQTGAEIKALYEAESNAFTDSLFTKLSNIEDNATADQNKADINALDITEVGELTSGSIGSGFTTIPTARTEAKCTDANADQTSANNAASATTLESSRTIFGNSFDGSDDVDGDAIIGDATGDATVRGNGNHDLILRTSNSVTPNNQSKITLGDGSSADITFSTPRSIVADKPIGFTHSASPTPSDGAALEIDFVGNGNKSRITFTGADVTVSEAKLILPTNISGNFTILIKTHSTGVESGNNRVTSWTSHYGVSGTNSTGVIFPNGSKPTITQESGKMDIFSFYWDSDEKKCYGVATQNFST